MTLSTFTKPPPPTQHCLLSFPTPEILLVTLNRPKSLNCVSSQGHAELHAVWEWMDAEPLLRVGIITGKGRAFCAGADLKEWNDKNAAHSSGRRASPPSGFAGLSRRAGKKPVICAVNGLAYGGGCEIIINADIVIASKRAAKFALPEVKRGVVALAGGLTRLVRTVGKQRAMEMALTGRVVRVEEAERWGLVNEVVEDGGETDEMDVGERRVVKRAVEVAGEIVANSPDAVIVSREGVKLGWEGVGAEDGSRLLMEGWSNRLNQGENLKEGVKAFVEKRSPRWVASKL
ncbi:transcriptional adapter 2-alpha [[Emmonsia] crescens]|uniref:Transcriptional adapter 2-alpha n=1 Tax=[Emmonsia] crescens TaxID=73230 RepID=A0A2B7Z8M7_9EURO|nr:transcriptional adapter 2-alpha [Emmonsia crescens]